MAINIGARKSGVAKIISVTPSFNITPGFPLPVPYPVVYALSDALNVSPDVHFNKDKVFTLNSDSAKVTGDELGTKGGVLSQTYCGKAEPIGHSASVYINGQNAVRCGDSFYMNNKNTIGTLICVPPAPKGAITDSGKVSSAKAAPSGGGS